MTAKAKVDAIEAVARRIAALQGMGLEALRTEWRRAFKTRPSLRVSADLLRRGIAYRVQEAAFGGLRADVARELMVAGRQLSISTRPGSNMKPGTTLIREWHGQTHTVRAVENGFEYEGQRYESLTKIARAITGVAWSGPRFFGLVKARAAQPSQFTAPNA